MCIIRINVCVCVFSIQQPVYSCNSEPKRCSFIARHECRGSSVCIALIKPDKATRALNYSHGNYNVLHCSLEPCTKAWWTFGSCLCRCVYSSQLIVDYRGLMQPVFNSRKRRRKNPPKPHDMLQHEALTGQQSVINNVV